MATNDIRHRLLNRRVFLKQTTLATLASVAGCARLPLGQATTEAGRLVMIDIPGTELDAETAAFIREHNVKAVVLFQRNIVDDEQTRRFTGQLRDLIGPDVLIAVDQEGGAVVRTNDLPYPPSAMCLGAAGSVDLAYEVGKAVGRGLSSLGINWNFAPDLDVNNNPLNPVISDRSFGSDPVRVAELGLAWARGCQGSGVATCVKHFPGHGDTMVDSHLGLPVVDKPRSVLEQVEFYPFHQAVRADIPAIMTAHLVYPALDSTYPATLSRAILTDLLRESWGYDGVVITDSMSMQAISDRYGRGDAALRALHAGADMVLAMGSREEQLETLDALSHAIRQRDLAEEKVETSLGRIGGLAARFPSRPSPYPPDQRQADADLMQRAWTAGLTVYDDPRPPAIGSDVLLLMGVNAEAGGATSRGLRSDAFIDRLRGLYSLTVVAYDPDQPLASIQELTEKRTPGQTVLFVSTARLRPEDPLKSLITAARPDLHIALWNPYTVLDVPAPALITYGFRPEALEAVVSWLKGEVDATGQLPIEFT
ncbi:MAG TPA: beta-N-acetylhexosaminidase [Rhodothermales bacterium]|nr:beta-N-acetylhexosaminidase [Rhodothermales bacterium]